MLRSFSIALAALGVLAALFIIAANAFRESGSSAQPIEPPPSTEATGLAAESAPPAATATVHVPAADPEPDQERELAPGEEIPYTPPKGLTSGILCPDGSYLPLLNGVPSANRITRNRNWGPLPPVVAKRCDELGREWYVHADGSVTSTIEVTMFVEGEPMENVQTVHVAQIAEDLGKTTSNPERAAAQKTPSEPSLIK